MQNWRKFEVSVQMETLIFQIYFCEAFETFFDNLAEPPIHRDLAEQLFRVKRERFVFRFEVYCEIFYVALQYI